MKNLLMVATVLLSVSGNVFASGGELLLVCKDVPTPDIQKIEVYSRHYGGGAEEALITYQDGRRETISFEETGLGVEDSIPLPKLGKTSRWLDNRHTGWAISHYTEGVVGHDSVDCQ